MTQSRRSFVKTMGLGGVSFLAAPRLLRGASWIEGPALPAARPIALHNNENPLGPGRPVLDAIRTALGDGWTAGRYPGDQFKALHQALADRFEVKPENVLAACGSTQLLRTAVQVFTSASKPLVGGEPTYEGPAAYAELIGSSVRRVPVDKAFRLDLDGMAEAAKGAGLVFLNNPNNPTATVLSADVVSTFIDRVTKTSPDTTILIDEAYHDYVTDPAHKSQIAAAIQNPRVFVTRTFSKAHGMAGIRMGYAIGHPDTIKKMAGWDGTGSVNVAAIAAAIASIKDKAHIEAERARNTEVRRYTLDWFTKAGFVATDAQANFVFVNIGRPAKEFREACRTEGILVARDFPPFDKTHARVSIGTMEEMRRATEVFGKILGVKAKAA
jgi:histidinol-phosphate aminotransferase